MSDRLTLLRPDDWHIHLRDGAALANTVGDAARTFGRAIVMPNLVPPVRVGTGAYTAAGTTVDADVPDGALAIGRVRQQIKEGWSDRNINFKGGKK